MLLALLLLVPLTALGLVLGLARLEETLLPVPAPADSAPGSGDAAPAGAAAAVVSA